MNASPSESFIRNSLCIKHSCCLAQAESEEHLWNVLFKQTIFPSSLILTISIKSFREFSVCLPSLHSCYPQLLLCDLKKKLFFIVIWRRVVVNLFFESYETSRILFKPGIVLCVDITDVPDRLKWLYFYALPTSRVFGCLLALYVENTVLCTLREYTIDLRIYLPTFSMSYQQGSLLIVIYLHFTPSLFDLHAQSWNSADVFLDVSNLKLFSNFNFSFLFSFDLFQLETFLSNWNVLSFFETLRNIGKLED